MKQNRINQYEDIFKINNEKISKRGENTLFYYVNLDFVI